MEILIILLLTVLNGIFALSEFALVSVKRHKIEYKAQNGSKKAQIVLKLLDKPESFLSSVQVGITLVGIIAGAYGASQLVDNIEPIFENFTFLREYSRELSYITIIGIITYFSIIIGELIPKSIALNNPENIALIFGPFINFFSHLTYPLTKLLSASTKIILKFLGIKDNENVNLSGEELVHLLKTAGKLGVIKKEESVIHQNIFLFSKQTAKSLKTHRIEVERINLNDDLKKINKQIKNSDFSKFPVYKHNIDDIIGVIKAKDFFEHVKTKEDLNKILNKPIFIPEMLNAVEILRIFKEKKEHLGIIIDEYGSFKGILTLHDLIEALVGSLPDSKPDDELEFHVREDNSVLISGSVEVHELNNFFNTDLIPEQPDNYVTLAGFIIFHLNRIPEIGEIFEYNNYCFEIIDTDNSRIDKVILKKASINT